MSERKRKFLKKVQSTELFDESDEEYYKKAKMNGNLEKISFDEDDFSFTEEDLKPLQGKASVPELEKLIV